MILFKWLRGSCSFRTNFVSFRTFKCVIFPKAVTSHGLFCHFLQQHCFRDALLEKIKEIVNLVGFTWQKVFRLCRAQLTLWIVNDVYGRDKCLEEAISELKTVKGSKILVPQCINVGRNRKKNWRPFCSEQLQREIIYQNARIFKRNCSPPAIYIWN